jgi:hypothetical protein
MKTQIALNLAHTQGALSVLHDDTPESPIPVAVGVVGHWLKDTYGNRVAPGYFELTGADAEEVLFQAGLIGSIDDDGGAVGRLADVLMEHQDPEEACK